MLKNRESSIAGHLISWTAALTTLAISPWGSYDPVNVPKLAVIAIGGFIALGVLISNHEVISHQRYRFLKYFGLAFTFDLLLVFFVSGTNPLQELFGTFGRATGLVTYLSLTFLLLVAAVSASQLVLSRFAFTLLNVGSLSIIYGIAQSLNFDPFNWVNQYSPVIGFLGNPNFQSSFVGLSAVMSISLFLGEQNNLVLRGFYLFYAFLALYVINASNSQQGALVFVGGSSIVGLIWISKSKYKYLTAPALAISAICFMLSILGSIKVGPLAGILFKESVTYRGDYWRAGWEMSIQHPFFGVGLDSYGDWYRRTRDITSTLRRGPDVTSNAAHNVLIDFSSNGGFPLAIIYILLLALVVNAAVRLIKRSKNFDPSVSGLIAVWIAYQAQSIISLNQLGLAVWGWIISGLILGYEISSRSDTVADQPNKITKGAGPRVKTKNTKVQAKTLLGMLIGFVIGLLAGLPPIIASSKYKSALESRNVEVIERAAYIWPLDPMRMEQVAGLLQQNKLEKRGLRVTLDGVEKFPDSYGLWALLKGMPNASLEQRNKAINELKRLDPNNTTLK